MNLPEAASLFGFLAGIQDGLPQTTMTAAEAVMRPEVVQRSLRFLTFAYTVVWVILAGYLVILSLRLSRLVQQLRRLRERL